MDLIEVGYAGSDRFLLANPATCFQTVARHFWVLTKHCGRAKCTSAVRANCT